MTCIVGLITDSGLIFGADSLVTDDSGNKATLLDRKVFIKNNILFGFCGTLRFGQLVKHRFSPPSLGKSKDIDAFVYQKFVPDLQKFFTDNGIIKIEENDFEFLIGIRKSIFSIGHDFSVVQTSLRYHAIGSGADFAAGVMYATKSLSSDTQRITLALEAASLHDKNVSKPFYFESLKVDLPKKFVKPLKPVKK